MRRCLPLGYEHRLFPNNSKIFSWGGFCFNAQTCVPAHGHAGRAGHLPPQQAAPLYTVSPPQHVMRAELTMQAESSDTGVCAASDLGHPEPPMPWRRSPERQQIAGYQEIESCALASGARLKQSVHVQNQRKAAGRGCRIIHVLHVQLSCTLQVYRRQDLQLFRVQPIGHTRRIAS